MTARMSTKVNGTFQPIVTPLQHCQYRDTCGAEKRIRCVKIFLRRFKWMLFRDVHLPDNRNCIFAFFCGTIPRERRTGYFFSLVFFSFFNGIGQQVARTKVSHRMRSYRNTNWHESHASRLGKKKNCVIVRPSVPLYFEKSSSDNMTDFLSNGREVLLIAATDLTRIHHAGQWHATLSPR